MKIPILGIGTTKFGELWEYSPRVLAKQAVDSALNDAGLKIKDIDALFVANMLSGILGGQENLGALFSDELGAINLPAFKIEGACASGGLAVHNAVNSVMAGVYQRVLILGIEKMTDHNPGEIVQALMSAGHDEERASGASFTGLYALLARTHMEKYQTTQEQMASVSVKNHHHASLNPKAQFQNEITIDQVMRSSLVADPLKLLDCSPVSDGAAAIIIAKSKMKKEKRNSINIIASSVATDTLGLRGRKDLTTLRSAVIAAKKAYQQAGIKPFDIEVAEVHDCFSIAEIIAMEDLGFFKKGEAAKAIFNGQTTLGKSKLVVNPSGGLKACGHPVGATGVKQICEITAQLRGEAGKRQVEKAKIGLTHNVGGSGAVAVVHILTI